MTKSVDPRLLVLFNQYLSDRITELTTFRPTHKNIRNGHYFQFLHEARDISKVHHDGHGTVMIVFISPVGRVWTIQENEWDREYIEMTPEQYEQYHRNRKKNKS